MRVEVKNAFTIIDGLLVEPFLLLHDLGPPKHVSLHGEARYNRYLLLCFNLGMCRCRLLEVAWGLVGVASCMGYGY
jgi:hypothetical protein